MHLLLGPEGLFLFRMRLFQLITQLSGLVLTSLFLCLNLAELRTQDAELALEIPFSCPRSSGFLLKSSYTLLQGF